MNYVSIGSDNGLSPVRRQAIIWANGGLLSSGPLGIIVSEILIKIQGDELIIPFLQVNYPHPGAYYNPQMAYLVQFQPYPGFLNYPQMPAQINNSQTASPPDVPISVTPGDEVTSALSRDPREQRF